jgi:carotenoid cleavage dioxygenase-like enzyme
MLYRCDRAGRLLAKAQFPLSGVPLIHDWVMAGRWLVFLVPPVRISVLPVLLGLKSYAEAMSWRPELGTQILIFDRDSLELVSPQRDGPFYQWHFGNGGLCRRRLAGAGPMRAMRTSAPTSTCARCPPGARRRPPRPGSGA